MLRLGPILLILKITQAQYLTNMENHNLRSTPARRDGHSNFQEIIRECKTDLPLRKGIKKNCWLLQKLSHKTGRNLIYYCFKEAMDKRKINGNKENSERNEFEGRCVSQYTYQRQAILKKITLRVSKNMMKLEKIFKNLLKLKKTQNGFIRMT